MFYILPPFINFIVLALPFFAIRTGGFVYWNQSNDEAKHEKTWTNFYREKPSGYWLPSPIFFAIQLFWATLLLIPIQ